MVQLIVIFSDYRESSSLFVNLGENFGWWDGWFVTLAMLSRVTCHELVTRCPRHIWPGSDSDLVLVPPPTLGPGSTGDPGQGNIGSMWENSPGHLLAPGDR